MSRKFNAALPGEPINIDSMVKAIAAYERTMEPGIAPFDRWIEGDESAISESAKRGFVLFNRDANCFACHIGLAFHRRQVPRHRHDDDRSRPRARTEERRRHAIRLQDADLAFGRDCVRPTCTTGRRPTSITSVKHYEKGGIDRPSRSPLMVPIELSEQERLDLVAFMETLTGAPEGEPKPTLPAMN